MSETKAPKKNPLAPLLRDAKVIVAVGSGGVGKTTTAAAVAIAAARQGRRCAVLTIDPARRLAQALGIDKMGNAPKPLPEEIVGPGSVDAMMLETAEAFDELVGRLVTDDERRDRLLKNRLYQVLAKHLGGTHEYMAVDKLFELSQSGNYDLVVVDTPPSVNALDFLDAPKRISSFFSEKIQKFFIKRAADSNKGFIQKLRDRAGDIALQVLGKALGELFIEDVQDFATAFQGLFSAFRERGVVIEKLLEDPGTNFVVVSGADPVRVREALEFAGTLSRFGVRPNAFIVNRVHQAPADAVAQLTKDDLEKALDGVDGKDAVALDKLCASLTSAREIRAGLARRDRAGLLRMVEAAGADKVLAVPELDDEVQDTGAVEHLLRVLAPDAAR